MIKINKRFLYIFIDNHKKFTYEQFDNYNDTLLYYKSLLNPNYVENCNQEINEEFSKHLKIDKYLIHDNGIINSVEFFIDLNYLDIIKNKIDKEYKQYNDIMNIFLNDKHVLIEYK